MLVVGSRNNIFCHLRYFSFVFVRCDHRRVVNARVPATREVGSAFSNIFVFFFLVCQVSFDITDLLENVRATMVAISNLKPEVVKGKYISQVRHEWERLVRCLS